MFGNGNGNAYSRPAPTEEPIAPRFPEAQPELPMEDPAPAVRKYTAMTNEQRDTLNKFIRRVCKQDDDGYATYSSNWSDEAVAEHLKIGKHHVSTTRYVLVGHLRTNPPPIKKVAAKLAARVATLERQLLEVRNRLGLLAK